MTETRSPARHRGLRRESRASRRCADGYAGGRGEPVHTGGYVLASLPPRGRSAARAVGAQGRIHTLDPVGAVGDVTPGARPRLSGQPVSVGVAIYLGRHGHTEQRGAGCTDRAGRARPEAHTRAPARRGLRDNVTPDARRCRHASVEGFTRHDVERAHKCAHALTSRLGVTCAAARSASSAMRASVRVTRR